MLPLPRRPSELALRLLLASVGVLALAQAFALDVVQALTPAIRAEVQALGGDYEVSSLDLLREASGSTLRLRANLAYPVLLGAQRVVPLGWPPRPRGWYQVYLNARGVLQSALLLLIVVLGWPGSPPLEVLLRFAFALPALAVLLMIDAPLELLGNLQEVVARPWDPTGIRPLFLWDRFLEAGGNMALALVFAALVLVSARRAVVNAGGTTAMAARDARTTAQIRLGDVTIPSSLHRYADARPPGCSTTTIR